MAFAYKPIDDSDISLTEVELYKNQSVDSSSAGITAIQYRSGSLSGSSETLPNLSGSYWSSLHVLFYLSGSSLLADLRPGESNKFNRSANTFTYARTVNPQHKHKFSKSGSIISIPQKYFGETIKPTSFVLTDNSHVSGTVTIKDDGYGNLYPVNNTVSRSTNSPSSSQNYVGNIFYETGIVTLTETSSYSHTPSTASITVEAINQSIPAYTAFFITGSDLSTSIKFISTGSFASETETDTVKYFGSGSSTANTAISASTKINDVFDGIHITSSVVNNIVTMSNDANSLNNRLPSTNIDNLQPISGTGGFNTTTGFGGGAANIKYTDVTTDKFNLTFNSTQTIYTREFTVTLKPEEFNTSLNYTLRGFPSGNLNYRLHTETPHIQDNFTGSDWSPYITNINFYSADNMVLSEHGYGGSVDKTYDSSPVLVANVPRPIRKDKTTTMIFKIRMDV